MKTSFITFAVVLLGTCLDLTTAAACDKTTRVDRCDNQECTYQNFNVSHVPDPRSKSPISCSSRYKASLSNFFIEDTKWDYYSFSCAKPEDPSKCEGIKQEDECVASQCAWHAYYEKKYKSGKLVTCTISSCSLLESLTRHSIQRWIQNLYILLGEGWMQWCLEEQGRLRRIG